MIQTDMPTETSPEAPEGRPAPQQRFGFEMPDGEPKILSFDTGTGTALVRFRAVERTVHASFDPSRYGPESPDRLHVDGFAAVFPRGRKVWRAQIEFRRYLPDPTWIPWDVWLPYHPASRSVPNIRGFLADFGPMEKAVALHPHHYKEDRKTAGQPNGPRNAAEVGNWSLRPTQTS